MKQETIQSLIDALAASDLSELEYTENGCTLRLSKALATAAWTRDPADAAVEPPASSAALEPASDAPPARALECLAPIYGVVHLQPSPDEPAFVVPGQHIKAGQTLCVIEAMKVFNEIRAEADQHVRAVLVQSGQEVEAGQPLFAFA